MELFNLDELVPVAYLADDENNVMFVRKGDEENLQAVALRVRTDGSQWYAFGLLGLFFDNCPLVAIDQDAKLTVEYYADKIGRTFTGDNILDLLTMYRDELEKWEKLENKWDYMGPVKTYEDEN